MPIYVQFILTFHHKSMKKLDVMHFQKQSQRKIPNSGRVRARGGSKAVWTFSGNSSILPNTGDPKLSSLFFAVTFISFRGSHQEDWCWFPPSITTFQLWMLGKLAFWIPMIKVQIQCQYIFTCILTTFRHKIFGRIIQRLYPHGHKYMKTLMVSDCTSVNEILNGS